MTEVYTPQEVTSMMNLIDTYIRHRTVSQRGDRSYAHYHPSEWGKCLRMQQYKHYAWRGMVEVVHTEPNSTKHRLFDKGHNMHVRWSNYFDDIGGILLGAWQCKNPLCYMFNDFGEANDTFSLENLLKNGAGRIYGNIDGPIFKPEKCMCGYSNFEYLETTVSAPELNIIGHADVVLNCDNLTEDRFKGVRITYNEDFLPRNGKRVVGDMKTIGSKAWANQLIRKGAHKDYMIQLTIYVHILDCDYGMIMYENKDNSEMMWFHVPRNDKWWEIVQFQAKKMIKMAEPDENGKVKLPPPRYDSKRAYACSWCEFKSLCHKSKTWDNPRLESNRREFYKELL